MMSFDDLDTIIRKLGITKFLNIILEISEDKVRDYELEIDNIIRTSGCDFDNQTVEELIDIWEDTSILDIREKYVRYKNGFYTGQIIIKLLKTINPQLKAEYLFKNYPEDEKIYIFHRDNYEAYNNLILTIAKQGINPIISKLILICESRSKEAEFFYFDYGITGEWQEWLSITNTINLIFLEINKISNDLFKDFN